MLTPRISPGEIATSSGSLSFAEALRQVRKEPPLSGHFDTPASFRG